MAEFEWDGHFIAGAWVANPIGAESKSVMNPNRNHEIYRVKHSRAIVSQAIDVAYNLSQQGSAVFSQQLMSAFASLMGDHQKALLRILQVQGKPKWEAQMEMQASVDALRFYAQQDMALLAALKAPLTVEYAEQDISLRTRGASAIYIPFSNSLLSFVGYFAAACLAQTPVVFFFPTQTSLLGNELARMLSKLGIDQMQIVYGGFDGLQLALNDERIKSVIYTGSMEHCEAIEKNIRSYREKKVLTQSGGKNAVLVHSSGDIDLAVRIILVSALTSGGQLCSSASRVVVHRNLVQELLDKLKERIFHMTIGPTDEPKSAPFMGPLYSEKSVEKFLRFQTMAQRESVDTISWGRALDSNPTNGYFVTPSVHLLDAYDPASAYQNNVLFCPDIAVYTYDVLDEAIQLVNKGQNYCVSFVGQKDILKKRANMFAAPNLFLNRPTIEWGKWHPISAHTNSHRFQGAYYALSMSSPQVCVTEDGADALLSSVAEYFQRGKHEP